MYTLSLLFFFLLLSLPGGEGTDGAKPWSPVTIVNGGTACEAMLWDGRKCAGGTDGAKPWSPVTFVNGGTACEAKRWDEREARSFARPSHLPHPNQEEPQLTVLFWNVENFFDFKDDGTGPSDAEFSATGKRHWSKNRFYTKCNAIAKTLLLCADADGAPPDIIGLAEVENSFVLKQLIYSTVLRKFGYSFVHFDSPDKRGIDCAAIYRKDILKKISAKPCHIYERNGTSLATRDILAVHFVDSTGNDFCLLVNHHPSKLGQDSETRRQLAMERMVAIADSIETSGCHKIVAVGDFNDDIPEFGCSEKLPNASGSTIRGTIKFDGKWEKIDGCALARGVSVSERILDYPHLSTKDNAGTGLKPLRTYNGPRYLGGVSDHYPVLFYVRR